MGSQQAGEIADPGLGEEQPHAPGECEGQLVGKQLCRKRSGRSGQHHCASSICQQYSPVAKNNSMGGHAKGVLSAVKGDYMYPFT